MPTKLLKSVKVAGEGTWTGNILVIKRQITYSHTGKNVGNRKRTLRKWDRKVGNRGK